MDYFHDLSVFKETDVLLLPPSFNTDPTDRIVGDQEVLVSGAAEEVVEISDELYWAGQYNKVFTSYKEQWEWLNFFILQMGRLRTFWYPSFVSDFTLYQDTGGPSGHCIYVVPNNFDWVFDSGRYGLFIQTINDRHIWEIADYKSDPNNPFDFLFTKSQLGKKIVKSEVLFASLIRCVRFETDKLDMKMETPKAGDAGYSLLERPREAEFVQQVLIQDLTLGNDHDVTFSGQVMVGADWWDPSSDSSNSNGDDKELRTNSLGASIELETEIGTRSIGIVPSNLPYKDHAHDGRVLENNQPLWAYRSRPVDLLGAFAGPWSSWSYAAETPHHDYQNGYFVAKDLDPLKRLRVQFLIAEVAIPSNTGDRYTRFLEPGESSPVNPLTAEVWSTEEINTDWFWQIKGFLLNSGGGLRTWADTRQKLKVLVLGDKDSGGVVMHTDGDDFEMPSTILRDRRGFGVSWPHLVSKQFEEANDGAMRVSMANEAYEDTTFMNQTDKMRAGTTPSGLPPTLAVMADLIEKFKNRTNSRSLKTGWAPDIVIFGYTISDQKVAAFLNDDYAVGQAQSQANQLWSEFQSEWDCDILVVPFPKQDSDYPLNLYNSEEVLVREELIDSVIIDHAADSWIEHVDIDALGANPGRSEILTVTEHAAAAGIVFGPFETRAEGILGL